MSCHTKNCNLDEIITYICKNDFKFFLKKAYVIGIGLGYKRKNSFYTCEKCIQVFVAKKVPESQIASDDIIPSTYKSIKTDVIETGIFVPSSLKDRKRPMLGGYSISPYNVLSECTAGCLVTNGPLIFILSVSHILAELDQFPIGHQIVQPSYIYGGRVPNDLVAKLHRYVPLRFIDQQSHPINLIDAAIGVVENVSIAKPEIAFIGKITTVKNPKLNGAVKKVGCTTELTEGTITTINAIIEMEFANKRYLFQKLIITTKMSAAGDSGALLVNNNNCGVGIICAHSDNASIACRLDLALDSLDVDLVK